MADEAPKPGRISENLSSDKKLVVRINFGGKSDTLPIAAVNHLFVDISKFNQQFSMGSMLFGLIMGLSGIEGEDAPRRPGSDLERAEEDQKMSASAIALIHRDTLNKIGLSLEPVAGKTATLMGRGEQAGSGEMRINVADRGKFTGFLSALEPEQVEITGLKPNLESLSGVLAQQVFDHYDLKQPSDEMLELFGGLGGIVNQYQRLGMAKAVEGLETYLDHARKGDLREFVAVERAGLMSEPGKYFGPADWQKDATPEFLAHHWSEATHILRMVRSNPKAQGLYEQLKDQLLKSIKISRADAESLEYYQPDQREKIREELERAYLNLDDTIKLT